MLYFDEEQLVKDLLALPIPGRITYAAACAERLLPAYRAYEETPGGEGGDRLRAILDRVWAHASLEAEGADELAGDLQGALALVPEEDRDPWTEYQAYADDAASAVAYAVRVASSGGPEDAAWAARRAYEALEYYVANHLGAEDDTAVRQNPIVQAELRRQRQDLLDLRAAGSRLSEGVQDLRRRAERDSHRFFGSGEP